MSSDVVRDFAAGAPDRDSAAWIGAVTWSVSDGGACWTDAKTGWHCPIGAYA
ncbi:hypothetical protein [Amycolatopsis kentuckyensis]|uniref:hypothetical protein n=1 Tax=Amycolatopsis kentuckyensis TaxID=218823 RepID=UPI0035639158